MTDHALIRYDAACRALAEAKSTDEVKDIRNAAEAMRAYAKQAQNRTMEIDAAEIRIRAERRLGELITAQKKTFGLAKAGRPKKIGSDAEPISKRPTLADAGIDKKLSSRSQKLAALPTPTFERHVIQWRSRAEQEATRVPTRLLSERKPKPKSKPARVVEEEDDRFEEGDALIKTTHAIRSIVADWPDDVPLDSLIELLGHEADRLRRFQQRRVS